MHSPGALARTGRCPAELPCHEVSSEVCFTTHVIAGTTKCINSARRRPTFLRVSQISAVCFTNHVIAGTTKCPNSARCVSNHRPSTGNIALITHANPSNPSNPSKPYTRLTYKNWGRRHEPLSSEISLYTSFDLGPIRRARGRAKRHLNPPMAPMEIAKCKSRKCMVLRK